MQGFEGSSASDQGSLQGRAPLLWCPGPPSHSIPLRDPPPAPQTRRITLQHIGQPSSFASNRIELHLPVLYNSALQKSASGMPESRRQSETENEGVSLSLHLRNAMQSFSLKTRIVKSRLQPDRRLPSRAAVDIVDV